mmetsp:Transcript_46303/g.115194  ORF Transcript_46303/g.115194 Transcript_46303/m.115194 type:complete len:188 (+) Transcript_46303:188-751(+)
MLPPRKPLVSLRRLDLSFNRIEGLTGNGSLPETLEELYLRNNTLRSIPTTWSRLPAVKQIELRSNSIDSRGWPRWFQTPKGYCDNYHKLTRFEDEAMLSAPNPPFWALVHTPNFSHNPLEIDVIHFLQPFRALPSLTYLSCENCVLFGAITDDALCYVEIEELRKWLRKPSEIPIVLRVSQKAALWN